MQGFFPGLARSPSAASHSVLSPFSSLPLPGRRPAIRHDLTLWQIPRPASPGTTCRKLHFSAHLAAKLYYSSAETANLTAAQHFTCICPLTLPAAKKNESRNVFLCYRELVSIIPVGPNPLHRAGCTCTYANVKLHWTRREWSGLSLVNNIVLKRWGRKFQPQVQGPSICVTFSFILPRERRTMQGLSHQHFTRHVITHSKLEISKRKSWRNLLASKPYV